VSERRLALGFGGGCDRGHPLDVALLAGGSLGLQLRLGLVQTPEPASLVGQRRRRLVAAGRPVLVVLALVDVGGLARDLGHSARTLARVR
jgi:hypothetical protein